MASKAASKRLGKEYTSMQKEPPPYVWAVPDEKNILTWNYLIHGPPDSPYAGGEYHGVLLFPSDYPFKPPGIKMLTPSGRFQTDKRICFSMSDFHPGSWNPAWSVATILTGLLSFMLSDEMTTGGLSSTDNDKRMYAAKSHAWNTSQKRFREAFPEHCGPVMTPLPNMGEKERGKPTPEPASPAIPAAQSAPVSLTAQPLPVSSHKQPVLASGTVVDGGAPDLPRARAAGWTSVIWEKWRWCALIMIAVVVSRLSSAS